MKMNRMAGSLVLALILTLLGLINSGLVNRSMVDASEPQFLSNFLEARGFPFPWLVTATSEIRRSVGLSHRLLELELLKSFLFFWSSAYLILLALRMFRRR